jgi:3-deoxy-D-manno-octulosonate 8-phosphate phosphatase (KDO 8-P phosphatase)
MGMGQPSSVDLAARCAPIELLLVDVDGVLTDGVIVVDDLGVESKHFHVRDGLAYSLWHRASKRSAILSGRKVEVVERRAAELKIAHVVQGRVDKKEPFQALLCELGLEARQVCYVGDDLIDLPVLGVVGLAAAPADAVPEVRDAVHLVTGAIGGRGVIREVVEVILKAQGLWHGLCESYLVPSA